MILCHKCHGVLRHYPLREKIDGLYPCDCLAGWVRDWQIDIDRSEATRLQIRETQEYIEFFARQGRSENFISTYQERLITLSELGITYPPE